MVTVSTKIVTELSEAISITLESGYVEKYMILKRLRLATTTLILVLLLLTYIEYWALTSFSLPETCGLYGAYYDNTKWQGEPHTTSLDTDISTSTLKTQREKLPRNQFSVEWTGYINIPETDIYTFFTVSDDGSWLFIDDTLVVDNGGAHGKVEKKGEIHLTKGLHEIAIRYFQIGGYAVLNIAWAKGQYQKTPITTEVLFPPDINVVKFGIYQTGRIWFPYLFILWGFLFIGLCARVFGGRAITFFKQEWAIILFFLYFAYLCVIFHNRIETMPDVALGFDSWWYFYQRIRQGSFAQWNPYSMLGRMAVQWNHIPISIFSPFLLVSGVTLKTLHICKVIGTFLAFFSIYWTGRMLKYDRLYTLIPVVLYTGIFLYKHYVSFTFYTTLFFLFPLAFSLLVSNSFCKSQVDVPKWLLSVIILSVAFGSSRLENFIYGIAFIFLTFVVFGLYFIKYTKKMLTIFLLGILTILIILLLNAWQLSILVSSVLNSSRVYLIDPFQRIFDVFFWKWVFYSILFQPGFILVCLNLCILQVIKPFHNAIQQFSEKVSCTISFTVVEKSKSIHVQLSSLLTIMIFLLLSGELALYKFIVSIQPVKELLPFPLPLPQSIIFSNWGIFSLVVGSLLFLLTGKQKTIPHLLNLPIAIFAGFYIGRYNQHFLLHTVACFMFWGILNVMKQQKNWIIITLVIFTFFGQTGVFFFAEIFGIPWNAARAGMVTVPFFIILILESIVFFVDGIIAFVSKFFKDIDFAVLRSGIELGMKLLCTVIAFLMLRPFFLPIEFDETGTSFYKALTPFARTEVKKSHRKVEGLLERAYEKALLVRSLYENNSQKHLKRVMLEKIIDPPPGTLIYYYLMPAFSKVLNAEAVYASEIPQNLHNIVMKYRTNPIFPPQSDMEAIYANYFLIRHANETGKDISSITTIVGDSWLDQVVVDLNKYKSSVYKEIVAREDSNTARVFLASKVITLETYIEEYDYLEGILSKEGLLSDQITTSDKNFANLFQDKNYTSSLNYDIAFEKDEPEHIVLKVHSNENAYLALMDLFSNGWEAFVDGKQVDIYRGYIGTRFISVEAGAHIVEFKYHVPGLIPSVVISIMTWVIMLALLILKGNEQPRV